MRILILTHFFPPGHLGGTEVLTYGLAKSLVEAGHSVQVICAEDWETAPGFNINHTDEMHDGIPVRRLRFNWMKAPDVFQYLYNNRLVYQHVVDYIRSHKPDIVHITSCYTLSASIVDAAADCGVKIILSATDFWFLCSRNTLLRKDNRLCPGPTNPWECAKCMLVGSKAYEIPKTLVSEWFSLNFHKSISRIPFITNQRGFRGMLGDWEAKFAYLNTALQKIDQIVTASFFLRDKFIEFGVDPRKIHYSSYGLDTAWAQGFETKTPSSRIRLGFIGQLIPMKGPDLLINAVRSLPENSPVELKIYGNLNKIPTYGNSLSKMADGDSRIAFRGTFENSQMGHVFQDIDLLVVPSTWYDFPLVIPSAFATKTPVIATNMPGMNELVRHEIDGLLFERYDWKELAATIERLTKEPHLLTGLKEAIKPMKTIDSLAQEYVTRYEQLTG